MNTDREDSYVKTGRDWRYTATSQGMPRIANNHQKLQRSKEGYFLRAFRAGVGILFSAKGLLDIYNIIRGHTKLSAYKLTWLGWRGSVVEY